MDIPALYTRQAIEWILYRLDNGMTQVTDQLRVSYGSCMATGSAAPDAGRSAARPYMPQGVLNLPTLTLYHQMVRTHLRLQVADIVCFLYLASLFNRLQ